MTELRDGERTPDGTTSEVDRASAWRADTDAEPKEPDDVGDSYTPTENDHWSDGETTEPAEPEDIDTTDPSAEDAGEPSEPVGPDTTTVSASDDDPLLRGEFLDRVKSVFGGSGADRVREITDTVDTPEFQSPGKSYPPDRYGTPLDRPDGTRTPLFDGVPTREQTKQGELGDCGVIATMGAVAAHRPEDIQAAVRENEDGTYEVRLHAAKSTGAGGYEPTGHIIKLTVTPDLPVHDELPDLPAFADSVGTGAAWAPVLEKAIAGLDQVWTEDRADSWKTVHNCKGEMPTGYVRLDDGTKSGDRAELMVQLTGVPAETWPLPTGYNFEGHAPKRQVLDHFVEKLSNDCPIVVGTRKTRVDEQPPPKDLVAGHAYEVTEVDDKGFIHLRNPYNRQDPLPVTFEEFRKHFLPNYTTLEPK
ncbi:hypothetical protein RM704_37685 [Streptomyces sp. DSM 3412]|uniref:Calpain catalytic domain-containing protein n=1 Tax=Streptomyces gottesmaniae TaxID=3075518 RepID=A0ABU2ZAI9_9ACTN|nr:C2 family cysteine protease [Streptomyces sp. DSM 3412]MDT0573123.1 hypothetical protein [Streptomyces sp. DSM 3412]